MKRKVKFGAIALCALAAMALLVFLVMSLWNWLAPEVFGWHQVTYWQALGLLALSKILFGGLRHGSGRGGRWRRRIRERWNSMTPEEREKFRHGMAARCRQSRPA